MDKKIIQNGSPGETERCENNFMDLDYQDNSLQKSLQSFQKIHCVTLKNSGTYKQIDKQKI